MHVIRLRGPWEYQWLPAGAAGRIWLPCDWRQELADGTGRVRLSRHFHSPLGLDEDETVWLVVCDGNPLAEAALNGLPLARFAGSIRDARIDITDRLELRNLLTIDTPAPAEVSAGPFQEVRLEIGQEA